MSDDALGLLDLDEDPPTPQILLPPTHKAPANAVDLFDELTGQQTQITRRPWMDQKQFILGTVDNLDLIMNLCIASGRYGIDLETSGLDNRVFPDGERLVTQDRIAGICLSPDGITGYYIPLNHYKVELNGTRTPRACNIPMSVFDPAFRRLLTATEAGKTIATFFHAKFDQEFLQFNGQEPWGTWEAVKTWDCMMLMAYLRDSRARSRGLKKLAKELLGIEMVELGELFPKDYRGDKNFSLLDPTDPEVLIYAGGDAICTVLLYPVLAPAVLEPASDERTQKGVYNIEKGCVTATRWMERNRIHLDMDKVWELTVLGQKEWFASVMEVYQGASEILGRDIMPGVYKALRDNFKADDRNQLVSQQVERAEAIAPSQYPNPVSPIMREKEAFPPVYDLSSPQQLGRMFQEMNVPGLKFTEKSGQVKTSKDELDRVVEEAGETFPFMKKIKKFRETGKALSSYLYPMLLDSEPTDNTMRINFRQDGTDTGRYATPSRDSERGKLKGFPQINLQGLPATYDTKRPECMLRLRECITPRPTPAGTPPKYLVSADYSGEELRLATNLSGEPKWVTEFFHCADCDRTFDRGDGQTTPEAPPRRCPNCGSDKIGDLHTLTGLEVYGREALKAADWKKKRDSAKKANFALSYGGGPSAVQRSTGCDQNEAHRIKRQFDATYRGLKAWWLNQHAFARKHKFVRTAFNRMYPVPDIDNADGGFRSKAERNAVNGPIQGSGGDMIKLAMAMIHKECKARGWLTKILLVACMHDELVFEIDADILEEALPIIVEHMTRNKLILDRKWPIPFVSDVEIGPNWTVPWDLNSMVAREARFIGDKKYKDKSKLPDGVDWDSLPSWPDSLRPWFPVAQGVPTPSNGGKSPSIPSSSNTPTGSTPPILGVGSAAKPESTPNPPSLRIGPPNTPPGGVYEFRIGVPLVPSLLHVLAELIHKCRGQGTKTLRLVAPSGEVLEGWDSDSPVLVDDQAFYYLARDRGLF